jgi:hypothetical protein
MIEALLLQIAPPDWTGLGVAAIQALIPIVTAIAIWAGRSVVVKVPRAFIPIIAVSLGTALDFMLAYVTGGTFSPIVGALLGASATWLRELIDTIVEHGMDS